MDIVDRPKKHDITLILKSFAEGYGGNPRELCADAYQEIHRLRKELGKINTPETKDFMKGVENEVSHQRRRWGDAYDEIKTPADWMWVAGHLINKALYSAIAGDTEKAKHHTITSAALMAQWHRHLSAAPIDGEEE